MAGLVIAEALANPAAGPQRVSDLLAARQVRVGPSKVWRILRANRLNTRQLRYQLLEAHRRPQVTVLQARPRSAYVGRLHATRPGELVQMDCFHVGSFKETRLGADKHLHGQVWQYTAIDVASSWTWARLEVSRHNPSATVTTALAHQVAADLQGWGWRLEAVTTDNGNEYRAATFRQTLAALGAEHRYIRAGRPQTNGKVERVQGILSQEFWIPALNSYLQPSISGLRADLADYLHYYNHQRPNRGRWNQGQTPAQIITPNPKLHP